MTGEHAVGRVIARPFDGDARRTSSAPTGRKDFSVAPPSRSYLDELQATGVPVHAVGKVRDLFAGVGIDAMPPGGRRTSAAIAAIDALLRDARRTASSSPTSSRPTRSTATARTSRASTRALREIDAAVGRWLDAAARPTTCSSSPPTTASTRALPHTDHTREHVPLLAAFARATDGRRHDGPMADVGATTLKWLAGREADALPGR